MTTIIAAGGYVVALAAIAGATVAVALGKIDGQTYSSIVAGFGGVAVGAGIHAAGVSTNSQNPSTGVNQ